MNLSEPDAEPRFRCAFGRQWPQLLPLTARSRLAISPLARETFVLNPRYHCQRESIPNWAAQMAKIGYDAALPVCWVPHPIFDYPEAYWPDPAMLTLIDDLAGGLAISDLNADCFELLSAGHLLIPADADLDRRREALFAHWRARLAHETYLHIPSLISPLQVAGLRIYTRARRNVGPLQHEDDAFTRRLYRSLDPVIQFWHRHLLGLLQQLSGDALRPSNNLISYYQQTGLAPHTDREHCIWNVSIPLDTEPANCEATPWPIWLETRHGPTPIPLQAGDALIYRGCEMSHWRDPLPPDRHETVLLFHFVDQDYTGPIYA